MIAMDYYDRRVNEHLERKTGSQDPIHTVPASLHSGLLHHQMRTILGACF
jgi:hypothetical protein